MNTSLAQSKLRFHFDMELTCDDDAVISESAKLAHSSGVSTKQLVAQVLVNAASSTGKVKSCGQNHLSGYPTYQGLVRH